MIHRKRFGRYCLTMESGALSALRKHLANDVSAAGFPVEATQLVLLAVEELAANVAEHGYGNRSGHPLWVQARPIPDDLLEITIEDEAPTVVWADLPRHDLDELAASLAPRGRGIALVEQIASNVRHCARTGGGNRWTLVFDPAALSRQGNAA